MGRLETILATLFAAVLLTGLLTIAARAEPLPVGEKAPDFKLAATTGGEIQLSDFRGKQWVLVEFYHADWGPT